MPEQAYDPTLPRQTSIQAYKKIQQNGLLSQNRLLVYRALYEWGPCTAGELSIHLMPMRHAAVSARLSELVRWKVAKEVGTKTCTKSGHTCLVFDVTDKLPVAPPARV